MTKESINKKLTRHIQDHLALLEGCQIELAQAANTMGNVLAQVFRDEGRVYIFGNGGSAADAQHWAAEFVNRYRIERPGLPAIALTTDSSILTSIGNDFDFRDVFAKQVRALAQPGDAIIGITTSGNSANVVEGLRAAREIGCQTLALLGKSGGDAINLADYTFVVPSDDTARIQEVHLLLEHLICDYVEDALFLSPARAAATRNKVPPV